MRNYKKKSECPRLESLLEAIECLPKDISLDELRNASKHTEKKIALWKSLPKSIRERSFNSALEITKYLKSHTVDFKWEILINDIEDLIHARQLLVKLINTYSIQTRASEFVNNARNGVYAPEHRIKEDILRQIEEAIESGFFIHTPFGITPLERDYSRSLVVIKNGFIKVDRNELIMCLQEEEIPIDRIRICPICEKIHWAKKINSKTCGVRKCVDANKKNNKKD